MIRVDLVWATLWVPSRLMKGLKNLTSIYIILSMSIVIQSSKLPTDIRILKIYEDLNKNGIDQIIIGFTFFNP